MKAYAWFSVASVNSFDKAKNYRDAALKKLNQQQIEEGQKLAEEIYNKIYK